MAEKIIDHSVFVKGGLLNNVTVEILEAEFDRFDYDGKGDEVTALRLSLLGPGSDDPTDQYLSVGGDDHFMPSKDGKHLAAVTDRSSLNDNSNFALFMLSFEKAGLKKADYASGIDALVGYKIHVNRVPDPRNINRDDDAEVRDDGQKRVREIMVVTEIKGTPKGKKGAKATKATTKTRKASTKKAAEDADDDADSGDDIDATILNLTLKRLATEDDGLPLEDLAIEVWRQAPKDMDKAERKMIMAKLGDEDYVRALDGISVEEDEDGTEMVTIG